MPIFVSHMLAYGLLWAENPGLCAVAEEWDQYTQSDGKGAYWDLLTAFGKTQNQTLHLKNAPYARAMALVREGECDMTPGIWSKDSDGLLLSNIPLEMDKTLVVFKLHPSPIRNEKDLRGRQFGWLRGYSYDKYLPFPVQFVEADSTAALYRMYKVGRVQAIMDSAATVSLFLKDHFLVPGVDGTLEVPSLNLPMYVGFTKSPKGEALMQAFGVFYRSFLTSGQAQKIFKAAGVEGPVTPVPTAVDPAQKKQPR